TWKRNVEAGRAAASWLGPERYLEVRYEHLVEDTEASVRRICDFLNERFEPTMLDNTAAGERISGPTGHVEVAAPVNTRSVAAWQTSMTLFDQKLSQHLAGSLLKELGYEIPDLPPMTTAERLRTLRLATRFVGLDVAKRTLFATGWLKMSREKAVSQNPSKVAT
ncbi:MAG: sulfotransferase, partial [Planctomycetota bacterium]